MAGRKHEPAHDEHAEKPAVDRQPGDVKSFAHGGVESPIHLEPTSSPQGSLTAPRPDDGTHGGATNLLDPMTGRHMAVEPAEVVARTEANVSSTHMPIA